MNLRRCKRHGTLYASNCLACRRERARKNRRTPGHPIAAGGSQSSSAYDAALKAFLVAYYSGGTSCCRRCGFPDVRALSIDHVAGGGSEQRAALGKAGRGVRFYRWLRANNCPPGYQILCMNCQWIKRHESGEWRPSNPRLT